MKCLLPEFFDDETSEPDHVFVQREDNDFDAANENSKITGAGAVMSSPEVQKCTDLAFVKPHSSKKVNQIKLIRIQGIEVDLEIPFFWVVNNLKNPEYYLHICVYMGSALNHA
ncbi:Autophagy protein 5 [Platanthera guangdongensis]|uniref:Autophagy protein 5 n=1 Tax=Platanthera guangdongensis TaxID=2320717 RepID=A0ABR2LR09_9ASPA